VNEYVGESLLEERQSLKKQDSISLRKGGKTHYESDSSDD
jgi:hypothetical protein